MPTEGDWREIVLATLLLLINKIKDTTKAFQNSIGIEWKINSLEYEK